MYVCDRCGDTMEQFYGKYHYALEFESNQPAKPSHPDCDHKNGHLCRDCRDEFRSEFMGRGD